jgi:hypothetical protein
VLCPHASRARESVVPKFPYAGVVKSKRLEIRVSPTELTAWRQAAGDRGVAELVRTAVAREIEHRREQAELEAATDGADPLAQLDALIRS